MARKASRKTLKRNLDNVTREIIRLRDEYTCQRCGKRYSPDNAKGSLDWSHIYSRTRLSMRWLLLNGILMCCGCHKWWHDNPTDSGKWFAEKWPHRDEYLRAKKLEPIKPVRTPELDVLLKERKCKLEDLKEESQGCQTPLIDK